MQRICLWLAAAGMTGFGGAFLIDFEALPPPADYLSAYEREAESVPWRDHADGGAWRILTLGEEIQVFEYRRGSVGRHETASAPPGCLEGLLTRLDDEGAPPSGAGEAIRLQSC